MNENILLFLFSWKNNEIRNKIVRLIKKVLNKSQNYDDEEEQEK